MKKALSILLSFVMLLSITSGLDLSVYAQTNHNELEIIELENFAIAALSNDGTLYRINGVSGDGKQVSNTVKIADKVKTASAGLCENNQKCSYASEKLGTFYILYLDKNNQMNSCYFVMGGSTSTCGNGENGKIFKYAKGASVDNVSKVTSSGYIKNNKLYKPYIDEKGNMKFSLSNDNTDVSKKEVSKLFIGYWIHNNEYQPYNVVLDKNGRLYDERNNKTISNDVHKIYSNNYSVSCNVYGAHSFSDYTKYHGNCFYLKKDGTFWSYDTYTKTASCIIKKTIKNLNMNLSKTSYTYNGKAQKPSVTVKDSKGNKIASSNYTVSYAKGRKNVGKYTVTIKFKGNYSGTVTKTFTIHPKSASISKLTAGKKKLTVKWKKLTTQTTGYQIQYSTDKNFKKNNKTVTISRNKTTSKTISKLKAKKKYYVRIRTYKTVKINGKNTKIYSGWSKAKAVTTKK